MEKRIQNLLLFPEGLNSGGFSIERIEKSRVELMPGIKGEGDIWYRSISYPTQTVSACRNPIAQVLARAVLITKQKRLVSETCR